MTETPQDPQSTTPRRRNRPSGASNGGQGYTATAKVAYQPYTKKDGSPDTSAHSSIKYAQTQVGPFEVPLFSGQVYITTATVAAALAALGHDPVSATVSVTFH